MEPTPRADGPSLQRLRRAARGAVAGGGVLLGVLLGALVALMPRQPDESGAGDATALPLPPGWLIAPMAAGLLYAAGAALVLASLPAHRGAHGLQRRFGAANQVTLLRLVLVCLLAALLVAATDPAVRWAAVVIATVAASLDGVDGLLARRDGLSSAFGARFDMETDALLVLVLAVFAWQAGVAGAWVLGSGLLRYLFVAAMGPWPWLARPLPPSLRRKAVCVLQILLLVVCLVPGLPAAQAQALALAGLLLLAASFACDVGWLLRQHLRAPA